MCRMQPSSLRGLPRLHRPQEHIHPVESRPPKNRGRNRRALPAAAHHRQGTRFRKPVQLSGQLSNIQMDRMRHTVFRGTHSHHERPADTRNPYASPAAHEPSRHESSGSTRNHGLQQPKRPDRPEIHRHGQTRFWTDAVWRSRHQRRSWRPVSPHRPETATSRQRSESSRPGSTANSAHEPHTRPRSSGYRPPRPRSIESRLRLPDRSPAVAASVPACVPPSRFSRSISRK